MLELKIPKIKISFFLLLVCAEELLSTPNITASLPKPLPSDKEAFPRVLNQIPYSKQEYLSKSSLAAPNKEFTNVKSALKLCDHKSCDNKLCDQSYVTRRSPSMIREVPLET